jgi:hypothetical protein
MGGKKGERREERGEPEAGKAGQARGADGGRTGGPHRITCLRSGAMDGRQRPRRVKQQHSLRATCWAHCASPSPRPLQPLPLPHRKVCTRQHSAASRTLPPKPRCSCFPPPRPSVRPCLLALHAVASLLSIVGCILLAPHIRSPCTCPSLPIAGLLLLFSNFSLYTERPAFIVDCIESRSVSRR